MLQLSLTEARKGLLNKDFSSEELTKKCLDQIEKYDEKLNSFLTVIPEEAVKQAKNADKKLQNGDDRPLLGIPIAFKDIFVTEGIRTTAGSNVLADYIPQYDGTIVSKLENAGAVTLGKTNLDAWAHGSSGENSDFGPTRNPYNTDYVPGGSSSGSPVALASDMCFMATGTDTGGSVRLPASFCNVVGLKPTYGRVSRYGVIAMASSLDSIGHFTKTVEDNAYILQLTAGKDARDATTPAREVPDFRKNLTKGVKGLRIGVPKEYFIEGLDQRVEKIVRDALTFYEKEGAEIVEVSLPHTEYAIPAYYIIMSAEVSSNLARYDGIRYGFDRSHFGDEAKRRIMLGTYTLSAGYYDAYYKKAMQVRTLLIRDFEEAWKKVDVMLAPVSPTLPWKIGEKAGDPLSMYLSDVFTVHANLVGIPGLSIPAGFLDNLPVGMQIFGPHFSEELLYRVGFAYELKNPWWQTKPELAK